MINIRRKENRQSRRTKLVQRRLSILKTRSKNPKDQEDKESRDKVNERLKLGFRYNGYVQSFLDYNSPLVNNSKRVSLKLNHDFSIYNNCEKVLESLTKVLWHAKIYRYPPTIKYDGFISIGAIHLLDQLCWEIGKKRKWNIKFSNLNERERHIISTLKTIESSQVENEYEYLINERIKINRGLSDDVNQSYLVKTTQITKMIERAIRTSLNDDTYELPLKAYNAINSTIGEQFDNILLHSLEANFGVLCGFYDKDVDEVTILIYNFGKTIAQTLMEKIISQSDEVPNENKEILADFIEKVIDSHTEKSLFNLGSSFTHENALTLLAIQEGISSEIGNDKTRGHGLTDFIEHCFDLTNDCKISILSGKTCIKINNEYQISQKDVMGRERRILAFNDQNDIYEKPDSRSVLNTKYFFNGVLIETIIPLNSIIKNERNDN